MIMFGWSSSSTNDLKVVAGIISNGQSGSERETSNNRLVPLKH